MPHLPSILSISFGLVLCLEGRIFVAGRPCGTSAQPCFLPCPLLMGSHVSSPPHFPPRFLLAPSLDGGAPLTAHAGQGPAAGPAHPPLSSLASYRTSEPSGGRPPVHAKALESHPFAARDRARSTGAGLQLRPLRLFGSQGRQFQAPLRSAVPPGQRFKRPSRRPSALSLLPGACPARRPRVYPAPQHSAD
jgi:hypothetical protein